MTRELLKWDAVAGELVSPEELQRRRDARAPTTRTKLPAAGPIVRCHEIWDRELGKPVPAAEYYERRGHSNRSHLSAPMVMGDMEPYRNVAVDGKMVSGRRQHRDMLRAHGLTEVGNEKLGRAPTPAKMSDPRADVKRAMEQVASGHRAAPVRRMTDPSTF